MQRPLNILWQKEKSSVSNLYIDIFDIRGHELGGGDITSVINNLFESCKSKEYQKSNVLAQKAREQGKTLFKEGKYIEAMNKFNRCVSGAENGTSEMGMAYANRSACFLNLNMPEECLIDIEMANNSNYPEELMPKLDERAAKCKSLMKDEQFKWDQFSAREPKLSFAEHSKFAGVADCLKVKKNEKFGRHIVTSCDLKIGQTILVENPYSIIINRAYSNGRMRCLYCFKECMNFITCENCVGALYCNEDCKSKSFHQYECNRPFALSRKETFELVLLMFYNINASFPDVNELIELVENLQNGQDVLRLTDNAHRAFASVFQLTTNHEKLDESLLTRFRAATNVAVITLMRYPEFKRKFGSLKNRRFLQHLLLHLFHIAEHAYDLVEWTPDYTLNRMTAATFEHFATGVYSFGCYMNHSCIPNVACVFVDGRLICKTIRPVKKGEQLFRSYPHGIGPNPNEPPEIKLLKNLMYNIECECIICTNQNRSKVTMAIDFTENALFLETIKPATTPVPEFRKWSRSKIGQHEKKVIEFLEKYNEFHPNHGVRVVQGFLVMMWHILATRV